MVNVPNILFDLDGTLLDSEAKAVKVAKTVIPQYSGRPLTDDELAGLRGIAWVDVFAKWFPGKEYEIYEKCLKEWDSMDVKVELYPGIGELFDTILSYDLKIGVVSSKARKYIEKDLSLFSVLDKLSVIVGSDETELHKPNPEPLMEASRRLGMPSDSLIYVGDQPSDVWAAKSAGMLSAGALWGDGDHGLLSDANPDYLLSTPEELVEKVIMGRLPV